MSLTSAIAERTPSFRLYALLAGACAGLALSLLVRAPGWWWMVAGAAVIVAAVTVGKQTPLALALALASLGWGWGSIRLASLDASVLAGRVGDAGPGLAVVTGPVRRGTFRLRMPAEVRRFGRLRLREPVLLELPLGRAPPQGALLEVVAEIRQPRDADETLGFDERAWLRRQGVQVVVRADHWRLVGRRGGFWGLADRLRAWVAGSLAPGVRGERHAVIAGVVLGADEGLSEDLRDRFRASGLYHLLAVSGQNVAFIAGGVLLLAWLLTVPRWFGHVAVLGAIGAYVLAVGLQPSVVRAGVAGALASLAWLAARPRERWYFLLVAAVLLLAWNPYHLLEPGFELSFTAVAAIFVAVPRLERVLEGYPVPRKLAGAVGVSLACCVATAPILALQFGAVPVYSVLANALAEPAMPFLLGLGLVTAALNPAVPSAAAALAWLNGWLAAYLAGCARVVGGLPYAQLPSRRAFAVLVAAIGFAFVVARLRPPRAPRALMLAALVALLGTGWHLRPRPAPPPPPDGLRITFLDVGQGDSALLQVPQGAVLVDEGPPEAHVASQLRRLGVRTLSAIVLTHPQRDHVGGAAEVLSGIRVGFALDPRLRSPSWDEREAMANARRHRTPVVVARAGQVYRLGRLRLRVLWPRDAGSPAIDPNERAVVLLASYGQVDALFTADAESNITTPLRPPPVEILKVAHHGSADPGLPALLRTLHPSLAVVSVGKDNDYGHPTPSTMAALAASPGLRIFRTDDDGRVVVESDGRRLWIRSGR